MDASMAPRPAAPGMNGAVRMPMVPQQGMSQPMLASQAPVAVQMGVRLPSQAKLETQFSDRLSGTIRARVLQVLPDCETMGQVEAVMAL
eukprot:Skav229198  [mRNA]  locus=scaffold1004:499030:503342:- [translate_table: standard]